MLLSHPCKQVADRVALYLPSGRGINICREPPAPNARAHRSAGFRLESDRPLDRSGPFNLLRHTENDRANIIQPQALSADRTRVA